MADLYDCCGKGKSTSDAFWQMFQSFSELIALDDSISLFTTPSYILTIVILPLAAFYLWKADGLVSKRNNAKL